MVEKTTLKKLNFLKAIFIIVIGIIFTTPVFSQVINTNEGTDFWFGFLGDSDGPTTDMLDYSLHITSFVSTTGVVTAPGFTYPFTVTPGSVTYITIPKNDIMVQGEQIADSAVHVVSNAPIAVFYSESSGGPRNDNTTVLPTDRLGTSYCIMSYNLSSTSEFMIVAPGTTVTCTVTPTTLTEGGHPANTAYTVTLNPNQVYQVRTPNSAFTDLTGSTIVSSQPVAVFEGTDIGPAYCNSTVDGIFEQALPVSDWGKSYIFVSTEGADDICRVLASQNGTLVYVNGALFTTLSAGQYVDQTITPSNPSIITANNPIEVGRILKDEACNNDSHNVGDADLILMQPNEQMFLDSVTFYANDHNGISYNYLQAVTRTSDVNTMFLDGNNIGSSFIPLPADPAYSYDTLGIDTGFHKLVTTGCGFLAYMCGLGGVTSSGCGVGVYLQDMPVVTITSTTPSTCSACDGTATANAVGGIAPFTYHWNTGATTSSISGLCAGIYTLYITYKCSTIDSSIIPINGQPSYSATVVDSNASCSHLGSCSVFPSGGTAPYTYSWTNGQTTQKATNLASGSYTCTITDNNGCKCFAFATIANVPPPVVTINPSNPTICSGSHLTLTGSVTSSVTTYTWTPSTGLSCTNCLNPIASPTATTIYTLTGTDTNGCIASNTVTVTVNPTPTVTISGHDSVCAGQPDTLTASGASNYFWNTGATTSVIVGTSSSTTSFDVTGTLGGCSSSASFTIHIVPTPTPTVSQICAGDSVQLTAAGGQTYLWSTGQTGSVIYVKPTVTTVYTVTAFAGDCSATATITVNPPPTVAASAAPPNICSGQSSVLTASGTGPFTWAPSTGLSCTNCANPTATPVTTTVYTVSTTVGSCTATGTVTVTINPIATIIATASPNPICVGSNSTLTASGGTAYKWTPANGLSSDTSTHPVATPSTTTTYFVTDTNGCSNTASITVTVTPVSNVVVSPNASICAGSSTILSASGSTSGYTWQPGNSTNASITVAPPITTTYTVTASSGNCGTPTATVTVFVNPSPVPDFSSDIQQGCAPLCIEFRNLSNISNGNILYNSWNYGDGDTSHAINPVYCYKNPGLYDVTLTVTSDSGCSATLKNVAYINVYNHPNAAFTYSPQPANILQPTVQFTDQSSDQYGIAYRMWTFGDATDSMSNLTNPIHTYADTGTYCPELIVMNIHGCTDSVINCLAINPAFELYIPSAFTPNGDGKNELFKAKGNDIASFDMYIFDRWGQQVFHTTDINDGWDGTLHGTLCQEDTYVYVISAYDSRHIKHNYTGLVNLLR